MSVLDDVLQTLAFGGSVSLNLVLYTRYRQAKKRLSLDECQCHHASSFHTEKGCGFGGQVNKHYDDVLRKWVVIKDCGCKRFVRLGANYDPNLEGDIAKLELIAKIQQQYEESHTPPNIQKRPWPSA